MPGILQPYPDRRASPESRETLTDFHRLLVDHASGQEVLAPPKVSGQPLPALLSAAFAVASSEGGGQSEDDLSISSDILVKKSPDNKSAVRLKQTVKTDRCNIGVNRKTHES